MTTTTLRRPKCSIISWFIFILPCTLLAIAFKWLQSLNDSNLWLYSDRVTAFMVSLFLPSRDSTSSSRRSCLIQKGYCFESFFIEATKNLWWIWLAYPEPQLILSVNSNEWHPYQCQVCGLALTPIFLYTQTKKRWSDFFDTKAICDGIILFVLPCLCKCNLLRWPGGKSSGPEVVALIRDYYETWYYSLLSGIMVGWAVLALLPKCNR